MPGTKKNKIGYPVMENFYTLQGEGFHTGNAAYFIRLAGCNVGCVWCDVKESWDATKHPVRTTDEIITAALEHPARIAVVTGGEPAMYDLGDLCNGLHNAKFKVHIETSGAYPLLGDIDWITVSPKKFMPPLSSCLAKANELKVVVFNRNDFLWAEQHAEKVNATCKLYLQPEWSKMETITPLLINYIKDHPKWQLSLQTHKYTNIP